MSPPIPDSRVWWMPAILVCAFLLRLGAPGTLGIDHFDEGVYASAGEALFANLPRLSIDPGIVPYGPPLTVVGIALSNFLLGGPSDFAAILPGILGGTLAVYLAFRLTRTIFGQQPAFVAAMLMAVSGMAIAFGRSAMTEAMFIVTWLMAMQAGARFLVRPGFMTATLLGLGVGLAQLTKYNGALTGVIVALTAVVDMIFVSRGTPRDFRSFQLRIQWGIFAAVIAAAVFAPWFLFVEDHGGYRSLMRHHGSYVSGVGRWISNLRLQLAQGWVLQAQMISVIFGAVFSIAVCRVSGQSRSLSSLAKLLGLIVLPNAPVFASACSIPRTWSKGDIARRMVVVWWVTMFLLTPLYHPYARLWLPFYLASLVLSANWVFGIEHQAESRQAGALSSKHTWFAFGVAVLAFVALTSWSVDLAAWGGMRGMPTVWSNRTDLRHEIATHAEKIRQASARGKTVHLLMNPTGRRALAFELGVRPSGPGRLAVVENLGNWQARNGPILIDLSLIGPEDSVLLTGVPRETLEKIVESSVERNRAHRGLITILDMAPGVALGDKLPATGLIWIEP